MPARCFLALTLPESQIRACGRARAAFLTAAPEWVGEKWVVEGNLHVTVAFLGAMPDDRVDEAVSGAARAAREASPFFLSPSGVVAVPGPGRANMLWVSLDDPEADVPRLRDRLVPALRGAVAANGSDPVRAHITLVRSRVPRRADRAALAAASQRILAAGKGPEGRLSVASVTLFSSTLTGAGPVYREMATLRFGG